MNVHKNARLTPAGRVLLVERIESGWAVAEAAGEQSLQVLGSKAKLNVVIQRPCQ